MSRFQYLFPSRPCNRQRPRTVALEPRLAPALFTVLNTADAGTGSFRQAVLDANAAPGQDTIDFDGTVFGVPQTIALPGGQITLADDVIVSGPGAGLLTVQNTEPGARVLEITAGPVSLSGMTITGGAATGGGGGVRASFADMTMTDVTLSGNTAAAGGGIAVVGSGKSLTLVACRVTGNSSTGHGGGVYVLSSNLTRRTVSPP